MKYTFTISPNSVIEEYRMLLQYDYKEYTGAYIGKYSYCWNAMFDNGIEFEAANNKISHNLHIGNYNSIGDGLKLIFGRNHNIKRISTGALDLMLQNKNAYVFDSNSNFNQKGSIIIQNDIWIGENVTIMAGVTVGNGAVIARNSHVVKNVPPYAVVGGNPARIIGYRYTKEQIEQLQKIQWWYWEDEKILENANYFGENIEEFCDRFFYEGEKDFNMYCSKKDNSKDSYFAFIDYYENYCSYPYILESFLEHYMKNEEKKLVLFIQTDKKETEPISQQILNNIDTLLNDIANDINIKCSIEVKMGTFKQAKDAFVKCSHYITNRTYDTVYFSCMADLLGMETISGTDSLIQFEKSKNFICS